MSSPHESFGWAAYMGSLLLIASYSRAKFPGHSQSASSTPLSWPMARSLKESTLLPVEWYILLECIVFPFHIYNAGVNLPINTFLEYNICSCIPQSPQRIVSFVQTTRDFKLPPDYVWSHGWVYDVEYIEYWVARVQVVSGFHFLHTDINFVAPLHIIHFFPSGILALPPCFPEIS